MKSFLFGVTALLGVLSFFLPSFGCGHYEAGYDGNPVDDDDDGGGGDGGDGGGSLGIKMENYEWTDENGETVELYDFQGDVIVLNVGAGWCLPCRDEAPLLESEIWQRFKANDFALIELLVEDDAANDPSEDFLKSWRNEYGLSYPVLADPDWSLLDYFPDPEKPTLPFTLFVDRKMTPVQHASGYDEELFVAIIESLL